MGLTFAFTRLNAEALIGFLAFLMWRLFKAAFISKSYYFIKSLTYVCEYHLNETDRSCLIKTSLMSRSFAEIESLKLSAKWCRLTSFS